MGVLVPTVIETTARGERASDIYSRLLTERIVLVGQEIDDAVADVVMAQLLHLEGEDSDRDISLHLNTPGGSVTAALAVYDTMQFIKPDVRTVCAGQAASMGAVLLAAGAPGKRLALPHSRVLLHQPSGHLQGQAADLEIHAAEIDRLRDLLWRLLAEHTGKDEQRIAADADRDLILPAEQARAYGLVDEVLAHRGSAMERAEVAA